MQVLGIRTPIIKPGDDLVSIVVESSSRSGHLLKDRDILVLSAKAVGTSHGRLVDLSKILPSGQALELSGKYGLDPAFAEVVVRESDSILGGVEHALSTIKRGVLIANAGADQSNSPPGFAALWPEDPQGSAEEFRRRLRELGLDIGVLIADSRTLPLRMGSSAVALGIAGFRAVDDLRGKLDLFGRSMRIKRLAVADCIASAAQLVMGETAESTPAALVRDAPVTWGEGFTIDEALIDREECLVMHLLNRSGGRETI